jgi:transposase
MGVQLSRPRRFFPPEYKAEVVELICTTGKTVGQVARELDLTETAVREWVKRADLDAGRRTDGLTTAERDELRRLRREVRDLGEEQEILRKAAVFFASMPASASRATSRPVGRAGGLGLADHGLGALWQVWVPESVKVLPASGRNCQS